jgi:hypothetical protein
MLEVRLVAQMELMKGFINLGRTMKLRAVVDQVHQFFQVGERDEAFADILGTLAKMEKFEEQFGVGSCINLENPVVQHAICYDPDRWKESHLRNARNAPSLSRSQILAYLA